MVISGNSRKFSTFAPKVWISNPSTIIHFLVVGSCHKNKTRTNESEILWKNKNSEPQPKLWLLLTKGIPRLELAEVALSTKVLIMLRRELTIHPTIKEYFWTDSEVVLGYVNNNRKCFEIFMANRIQLIWGNSDRDWNKGKKFDWA